MGYKVKKIYVGTQQVRPETIPTSGLLGYRPLQSDLKDASGNGKNGSWYSGTGSFGTQGNYKGAYVTRQSSNPGKSTQHIVTPVVRSSLPISICVWICYTQMSDTYGLWRGSFTSQNPNALYYISQGLRSFDNKYPYAVVNNTSYKLSSSTPTANTWYFIVITYDGSSLKYYLNGSLTNTLSISANNIGDGVFRFGCSGYDANEGAYGGTTGYIRHCAIYNRVLTDAEVLQFYNHTN